MSSMTTEELEVAFRAHATELRSFLHRQLRNPETAADLTQETYLRLLRQPPRKPLLNLAALSLKLTVTWRLIMHAAGKHGSASTKAPPTFTR